MEVLTKPEIREATAADLPRLVEMGHHFLTATPYRDVILDNPSQMLKMAQFLVDSDDGVVLVAEHDGYLKGMIGLLIAAHHISAERMANEVFWWVEPDTRGAGLRLLRAAERWALAHGAVRIQMVAPDAAVGKIYERFGYAPMEMAYQRRLA